MRSKATPTHVKVEALRRWLSSEIKRAKKNGDTQQLDAYRRVVWRLMPIVKQMRQIRIAFNWREE